MKRSYRGYLEQRDLVLVGVLALATVGAVAFDLIDIVRIALAIPLVLFLPGYAVGSALLPARPLEAIERVLIALGLSLVITILAGLVLALSPAGLSPLSWALLLAGITIAGCLVAAERRVRAGISGPRFYRPVVPLGGAVLILLASLIASDVLLGAGLVARQQDRPAPEQLWLLETEAPTEVRLGMRAGAGGGGYTIRLSSAGEVIESYELSLEEGEAWQTVAGVPSETRQRPLVARLYAAGADTELRFVVLQPAAP